PAPKEKDATRRAYWRVRAASVSCRGGSLERVERHLGLVLLAVAHVGERRRRAGRDRADLGREVDRVGDAHAGELRDDVALPATRLLGGAVSHDLGDVRAGRRGALDGRGRRDARAQHAVRRLAVLDDLVRDALGDVRRNREAEADRAALLGRRRVRRRDRDVDADELALVVDERAARVAGVDGGIGLQHGDLDRLGRLLLLLLLLARQVEEPGRLPAVVGALLGRVALGGGRRGDLDRAV